MFVHLSENLDPPLTVFLWRSELIVFHAVRFQTHRGLVEICVDDKCIKYGDHAKRQELGLDADEGGTR